MLLTLINDPQTWLEEYHSRSICETVNSTFKRDFPTPLRKKLDDRRKQEAFTRVCDYDLKRLCYLRYLEKIDIHVGHSLILPRLYKLKQPDNQWMHIKEVTLWYD